MLRVGLKRDGFVNDALAGGVFSQHYLIRNFATLSCVEALSKLPVPKGFPMNPLTLNKR